MAKGAYQQSSRNVSRRFASAPARDAGDSAFYGIVTSSSSGAGAVPRAQPRGKGATGSLAKGLPQGEATFDDNGYNLGYSAQDK